MDPSRVHFFWAEPFRPAAIAVPRGQDDLKQAINAALAALQEKGVYAELYLRYFPVGFF